MSASLLRGLSSLGDDDAQLVALHELNNMLLNSQGDIRVSPYLPPLLKIIQVCEHNPELVLMSASAALRRAESERTTASEARLAEIKSSRGAGACGVLRAGH